LPMADRDKTNQLEIPSAMLSQNFRAAFRLSAVSPKSAA
jgi:hypothetical protein